MHVRIYRGNDLVKITNRDEYIRNCIYDSAFSSADTFSLDGYEYRYRFSEYEFEMSARPATYGVKGLRSFLVSDRSIWGKWQDGNPERLRDSTESRRDDGGSPGNGGGGRVALTHWSRKGRVLWEPTLPLTSRRYSATRTVYKRACQEHFSPSAGGAGLVRDIQPL
jgi:hypothetical protein